MKVDAETAFTKEITAHSGTAGWHLIASPLAEPISPATVGGMITDELGSAASAETATYDLYYFDQTGGNNEKEWKNYRQSEFNLESGTGYLYASKNGTTLTFTGEPYNSEDDKVIQLSKTDNNPDESMRGWNLVGNPYTVKAYPRRDFYVMNPDGNDIVTPERNYIEPMEGAFVYAEQDGELFTFFKTPENSNDNKGVLSINVMEAANHRGNRLIDRAVVRFGEGNVLPKFMLNENHTKVYIPQDNKEFAIVSSEGQGEMSLSFRANENGTYTLSFNAEEVSFNYLHLIDNMTGADVDLLAATSTGSVATYTFNARTTDYSSRFRLVFAANNEDGVSTGSTAFAFYSNGTWVINNTGEATLQVIDVTGRVLSSETVNGSVSKAINASAGVYMLRLINGNDVKTQKIVVR